MEKSTSTQGIWNWADFSGWEADGFLKWPVGSFRVSSGIDNRTYDGWIRNANKFTATAFTYDWTIQSVNPYAPITFATRLGNACKIYYDGAYMFDMSTGTTAHDQIMGFAQMNRASDGITYSYWISATHLGVGKIHRFSTTFWGATTWVWTYTLWGNQTNFPSNNKVAVVSLPASIAFWVGNSIYWFTDTEVLTRKVVLQKNAEIVGISYYNDKFKVFYNVKRWANGTADSYVGIWDGIDENLSQVVKFDNSEARFVINDGDNDFVAYWGSSTSDLYVVQGLTRTELRVNVEGSASINWRFLGTEGFVREGICYFNGTNKLGETSLYSYGKFYSGNSRSLVCENVTKVGSKFSTTETKIFTFVDGDVSANVGKVYEKPIAYLSSPETVWTLISFPIRWQFGLHSKKTIESVKVGYQLFASWDSIAIYYRRNSLPTTTNWTGWTLIKTITDNSKQGIEFDRSELSSLWLGDFNQLEYKVVINASSTYSPVLTEIRTCFTDNMG